MFTTVVVIIANPVLAKNIISSLRILYNEKAGN
jgi:hypothetical protein